MIANEVDLRLKHIYFGNIPFSFRFTIGIVPDTKASLITFL